MAATTLQVSKLRPGHNIGAVKASTTIPAGALIGKDSSGNVVLASNTSGAIVPAIGFNGVGQKNAGDQIGAMTEGIVSGFSGLTVGAQVYLCAAADTAPVGGPSGAGGYTQTRPTAASGKLIQEVGHAITTTDVLVNIKPSGLIA